MKRTVFLFASMLIMATSLNAQRWIKTYGGDGVDLGNFVQQTSDGGFIVVGFTNFNQTHTCIWLLKTDFQGDIIWTRKYGLGGSIGKAVFETRDSGFAVFSDEGFSWSLLRLDSCGGSLWSCTYDGNLNSVQPTTDGGYILGLSSGGIMKIDSLGDTEWTGEYSGNTLFVDQTADGGYIMTGIKGGGMWLAKIDSSGDSLWSRIYTKHAFNQGRCVRQTPDGGYIVTGVTYEYPGPGAECLFVVRTDSLGDSIWSFESDSLNGIPNCVDIIPSGGYILAGNKWSSTFREGGWLLKFNDFGDTVWTRVFRLDWLVIEDLLWVANTADGGFISTGGGYLDYPDLELVKTDSLGSSAIDEPGLPATPQSDFEIGSFIGSEIALSYANHPRGFHVQIFDASGRKVDEIKTTATSGTALWGKGRNPGAYFLVSNGVETTPVKVIIVK